MDEWTGEGILSEDPEFNDDFTLQFSSPCIDTGDPNSELDPDATRADMGAHYFHQSILGDINNDGTIDILDIVFIVNIIINNEYNEIADLNDDGNTDILDVVQLIDLICDYVTILIKKPE